MTSQHPTFVPFDPNIFVEPMAIALQLDFSGDNYDVYVTDSSGDNYNLHKIRKISVPKDAIQDDYSYYKTSPSKSFLPPNNHLFCKPSGLALTSDGQSAIFSCPEENAIYMINLLDFYRPVQRIAGGANAQATLSGEILDYVDGFGSAATFRYPGSVAVSPDGKWALIAE